MAFKYFITLILAFVLWNSYTYAQVATFKFDFGTGKVADDYTRVLPDQAYSKEKGYGKTIGLSILTSKL